MEANKRQIADIFNGHRVLRVPFFQRSYVWGKEQWKRFLDDMEYVTHRQQDYFLGSVILKQDSVSTGISERRSIIDGQQRFTTLAIFTKVLCLKTNDMATFNQHFTVRNRKEKTNMFALEHSLIDKSDFEYVLNLQEDKPIVKSRPSNIIEAYNFFQENIDINRVDIDILFAHIVFIAIDLQPQDDEQVIFDTINSLGVRLTTAELLKNYFFAESSLEEYNKMWTPVFEKDQATQEYWDSQITAGRLKRSNIDAFFSAYLNIKIQDPTLGIDGEHKALYRRADSIFNNYKDLISTFNVNKQQMFTEIIEYAKIYQENINPDIARSEIPGYPCIERMNFLITLMDCSTMLPYVLYILKNVDDMSERTKIFGYLETYIVRRHICKSENNSYSDLFTESLIGRNIKTYEALKENIERREYGSALSMPDDKKVEYSLMAEKQTNSRALAIIYLMESRLRAEEPHATKLFEYQAYSLEHIMPKKYEKNWPLDEDSDEKLRETLILTLGNMTLLPMKLNSSISNANWETKKHGNKSHNGLESYASDLVTLRDVIALDEWNEKEIFQRAMQMAKTVSRIWPFEGGETFTYKEDEPTVTNVSDIEPQYHQFAKKLDTTKYSLDDETYFAKRYFVPYLVYKYQQKYPSARYSQIKQVFNDSLCAKGFRCIGLLCTQKEYEAWDVTTKEQRYEKSYNGRNFVSYDGIVFYVNNQWTQEAMASFVKLAESEGWHVYTKSSHDDLPNTKDIHSTFLPFMETVKSTKRKGSERQKLKITLEDGKVIYDNNVTNTFITFLKYVGCQRIRDLNIYSRGDNLITTIVLPKYQNVMKPLGNGLYVNTNCSTQEKYNILSEIKWKLKLDVKIELV